MLALKTGCPIVPVYIQGTYEIWPRNQKLPKIRGKTLCVVGKPLEMSEFSSLGKKEAQELLSKQLQKSIKDLSSPYHL